MIPKVTVDNLNWMFLYGVFVFVLIGHGVIDVLYKIVRELEKLNRKG